MKTIFLLFTITLLLSSCKKKGEDVAPASLEDFTLAGYLQKTGFNQKEDGSLTQVPYNFESGLVFETKAAGNITAFMYKSPSPMANVKIILWDGTTATPIATKTFNYIAANVGQEFSIAITPIALQKNTKYCISFATNKGMYYRTKTDGSAAAYPIEFKNLKILAHQGTILTDINLRQFPYTDFKDRYLGDISFTFQ